MTNARDEAIAATGQPRGRGAAREFDVNMHLKVSRDLHRRVAAFAEAHQTSNADAFRRLVELALTELEKTSG